MGLVVGSYILNARGVSVPLLLAGLLFTSCSYARGAGVPDSLPPGRPGFYAGMPEGYWIWQDQQGWHLRITCDVPRHFHGAVANVGFGGIKQVKAVGTAARGLRSENGLIAFDMQVEGGVHGFDWSPSSGCNRFELYIDGASRPLRVFLGGSEESPAHVPFAACN